MAGPLEYGDEYGEEYGGIPATAIDHVMAGIGRFLEQDKAHQNFEKLAKIALARWQNLENLIRDIEAVWTLDDATGELLQFYGRLATRAKLEGWSDATFRKWIKLTLQAARSNGTAPELIQLAKDVRPATSATLPEFFPEYPEAWRLQIPDVAQADRDTVVALFEMATAAPERGTLVFYTPASGHFVFDKTPGSTHGWSAGKFASRIHVTGRTHVYHGT